MQDFEWFYSELLVPVGSDVIGSYFATNGFSEGYFGIQVKESPLLAGKVHKLQLSESIFSLD